MLTVFKNSLKLHEIQQLTIKNNLKISRTNFSIKINRMKTANILTYQHLI